MEIFSQIIENPGGLLEVLRCFFKPVYEIVIARTALLLLLSLQRAERRLLGCKEC